MNLSPRNIWQFLRQKALICIGSFTGREFILTSEKCLIIAPHPDDEVFGCGGLLAALKARGKSIDILFLTNGDASHKGCCETSASQIAEQRKKLAVSANKILDVPESSLHFFNSKDGKIPREGQDGFSNYAEKIAEYLKQRKPDVVFCPHPFEGWSDHIAAQELTRAAITILPNQPKLYYYCVWFWYSMPLKQAFRVNWKNARLLDITKQFPSKQQAINIYLHYLAPCGNSWSGNLPPRFLRAFDWHKELFFEADIKS